MAGVRREFAPSVRLGLYGEDVRPVPDGDRGVVTGDSDVHDPLQQSGFATYCRVDGLHCDPGAIGDVGHRGGSEATGEEQTAGRGEDAASCYGGGSLATGSVIASSRLDKLAH